MRRSCATDINRLTAVLFRPIVPMAQIHGQFWCRLMETRSNRALEIKRGPSVIPDGTIKQARNRVKALNIFVAFSLVFIKIDTEPRFITDIEHAVRHRML